VNLGEAEDIRVEVPGWGYVYIECKRPRTVGRIAKDLKDGAHQVAGRGPLGLVAIDLEVILSKPSGRSAKSPARWIADSCVEADRIASNAINAMVQQSKPQVDRLSAELEPLIGVIWSGLLAVTTRKPTPAYSATWYGVLQCCCTQQHKPIMRRLAAALSADAPVPG
jgi:hypothetical protein